MHLHEDFASGAPHRVDRDGGVIYGVKVLGSSSRNTHGRAGVSGTEYLPDALVRACPLYENAPVFSNHDRERPAGDRPIEARLGKLCNVRVEGGALFADLHLLKSHPMAERLLEAAERMPDAFGLSHHAVGRGEVRGGKYVITEIPEVRSVDVVSRGATTRGLFEEMEKIATPTLREALKPLKIPAKALAPLWEAGYLQPDMAVDAPAEGGAEAQSWEDHLGEAVKAILQDDSLEMEAKKAKIVHLLKTLEKGGETPAPVADFGGDGEGDGDGGEGDGEDEKMESLRTELKRLRQDLAVRDLCESERFAPTALQRKVLSLLESDAERKELIESYRAARPAGSPAGPRSAPPAPARTPAAGPPANETREQRLARWGVKSA